VTQEATKRFVPPPELYDEHGCISALRIAALKTRAARLARSSLASRVIRSRPSGSGWAAYREWIERIEEAAGAAKINMTLAAA
jgi:hypothetical protein